MPQPTPNDLAGKLRDMASKTAHFMFDATSDACARLLAKVRADDEAVREITDLLTTPPGDDPLAVIHEIEDRLGVDHYDWTKCGRWVRRSNDE